MTSDLKLENELRKAMREGGCKVVTDQVVRKYVRMLGKVIERLGIQKYIYPFSPVNKSGRKNGAVVKHV